MSYHVAFKRPPYFAQYSKGQSLTPPDLSTAGESLSTSSTALPTEVAQSQPAQAQAAPTPTGSFFNCVFQQLRSLALQRLCPGRTAKGPIPAYNAKAKADAAGL